MYLKHRQDSYFQRNNFFLFNYYTTIFNLLEFEKNCISKHRKQKLSKNVSYGNFYFLRFLKEYGKRPLNTFYFDFYVYFFEVISGTHFKIVD